MKDIETKLHRAFNPRSVAVVGDKREMDYMWLRSLAHFQGKLYSVQIDEQELPGIEALGVKNYHSLLDIPVCLLECSLAVHHSLTAHLAQVHHHRC